MRKSHRRAGMVLALGAATVIGGGVLAFGTTGSQPPAVRRAVPPVTATARAQSVADDTGGCDAIHRRIENREDVDVGGALQCDQVEFQTLENERQAARARGEKPAMRISETCRLVNERAAGGDATLDFDLAFGCRQRERFANATNATTGLEPGGKLTSLCVGAERRQDRGEDVDDFTRTFCAQEERAAAKP